MDNNNPQPPSSTWLEDADLAKAPTLVAQLEELEKSPGWALISSILERQASIRVNMMLTQPLKAIDGTLEQEYIKGEAATLHLLRGLPTVLIDELKEAVKRMREDAARSSTDRDSDDSE